jgi:uncharacterized repeat protein (TIGR01451 family)
MNYKKIIILSLLVVLPLFAALPVRADYLYGGPTVTSQILVDKLVKNPSTGAFVDNLGPSDSKFSPEGEVVFKIVVKNQGSQGISGVTVRDILPTYLDFVSGPADSHWNKETKELIFNVGDLQAGETKEYEFKAKAVVKKDLPADKSVICITNWVEAKNDTKSDSDSAGLCISNVSILPPTGPDPLSLNLVFALGASGFWLIRKNPLV